jgi:ABC-type sugar transport system ATPase subunit
VTDVALAVEEVAVGFGDRIGLADITFSVTLGGRLALVGPSGVGKTTLLRGVAGLAPITRGRITVAGRDVASLPPEARDVVYLHQTPMLFPHLSVGENVAFPLRVRRLDGGEVSRRMRQALELVRLTDFERRMPRTLSGGQRHRVALARALVARPTVLLLDEPLSSLDPTLRDDIRAAIVTLQTEYGAALVVVTHDLDEAALLGDRVGVLLDGALRQIAGPAELFAHPASLEVARFLGIPNAVPGQLYPDGRFESVLGTLRPTGSAVRPGPAVAVFRPEAIAIADGSPLLARVAEIRHRARETTAVVRLADTVLEMRLAPSQRPRLGDTISLALDPAAITLLPDA